MYFLNVSDDTYLFYLFIYIFIYLCTYLPDKITEMYQCFQKCILKVDGSRHRFYVVLLFILYLKVTNHEGG